MEEEERKELRSEIKKQISELCKLPDANACLDIINAQNTESSQQLKDIETLLGLKVSNRRESAIIFMAGFLWLFEGFYTNRIDQICFVLVKNKHDLFDFFKREYAKSVEDINNVDIFTKFKFLKEHGFRVSIRDGDRKLRNKIAHHSFSILDDGKLKFDDGVVDVEKKWHELAEFTGQWTELTTEVMRELTEEIKKQTAELRKQML